MSLTFVVLSVVSLAACGNDSSPSSAPTTTAAAKPAGYDDAKAACNQFPALKVEAEKVDNRPGGGLSQPTPTDAQRQIVASMLEHVTAAATTNPQYNDLGNVIADYKSHVDNNNGAYTTDSVNIACQRAVPAFGFGSGAQ